MFCQCRYDLCYGRCFLTDSNINTDDIFPLLVDDRIGCDRCLTGLTVSDDKFTLSTTDREHGINGKNTCFHWCINGLSVYDSRCIFLHRTIAICLDLAVSVDRLTQSIDDSSDKGIAYRNTCFFLGSNNLCSFFDSGISAK